jgi:hypothetical protein
MYLPIFIYIFILFANCMYLLLSYVLFAHLYGYFVNFYALCSISLLVLLSA